MIAREGGGGRRHSGCPARTTMTRRAKTDLAIAMAGLALLLLSAASVSAVTSTSPQVTMRFAAGDGSATLTGVESTSSLDFLGIPFAEPPTGPRRFQPATPKSISSSEFNATSFGAACPQPACMHARQGCPETYSEDCLFLNVFVPKGTAPKGGWPVFVWIHGGAFVEGTASVSSWSESGVFANEGVMLVTANYRLGALGWMAGGGLEGNYGLSDQREALRWVRDHIAAFGGDDSQITVGGESAGAMSILAHIASPEAAGLFDAAIVESGTIALPYGTPTEPGTFLVELSRKLGCPQDGGGDVAACLRALSSEEINSTVTEMANPGSIVPVLLLEPMELAEPFYPTIGTADLPLHPLRAFEEVSLLLLAVVLASDLALLSLSLSFPRSPSGKVQQGPAADRPESRRGGSLRGRLLGSSPHQARRGGGRAGQDLHTGALAADQEPVSFVAPRRRQVLCKRCALADRHGLHVQGVLEKGGVRSFGGGPSRLRLHLRRRLRRGRQPLDPEPRGSRSQS